MKRIRSYLRSAAVPSDLLLTVAAAPLPITSSGAAERDLEHIEPPLATTPGLSFDIAVRFALTSGYVSRGISNSNTDPAVQGYLEPSIELRTRSSSGDYGEGFEGAEIDVAGGIRPKSGPLSSDLGYVHYFYAPEHASPTMARSSLTPTISMTSLPSAAASSLPSTTIRAATPPTGSPACQVHDWVLGR